MGCVEILRDCPRRGVLEELMVDRGSRDAPLYEARHSECRQSGLCEARVEGG